MVWCGFWILTAEVVGVKTAGFNVLDTAGVSKLGF